MDKVRFGGTDMDVFKIALGGYPFAGVNKAQGWDPYSPEGKKEAIATINAALDGGINYIDTAPGYGEGHSETLIGEVMRERRQSCYLATKCPWGGGAREVVQSLEASLKRLRCDYVDVLQLHGGRFSPEDQRHILEEGPLEGLREAKARGLARYVGVTVEEPWTAIPFVEAGAFDVIQICYNLIRQSAGQHLLDRCAESGIAVCAMRPLTSGIFQRELEHLAPGWLENGEAFRVCMAFILSDSRVHMANVGMRWRREVEANIEFARRFEPAYDIASTPRLTQHIYESDDRRKLK
ncbi:MAG: aldo/keto reductase [Clostridiales bacterium]|nr:aldo/keto reductase [Clostridiales bacterium]